MSTVDDKRKEGIKHLYNVLKGYYANAPEASQYDRGYLRGSSLLTNYNKVVDELSSISGNDYSRFKVPPAKREYKLPQMDKPRVKEITDVLAYRQQLGGIILALQSTYFPNDPNPVIRSQPGVQITQVVQQNQSVVFQLVLQGEIDSRINKYAEGTKERSFLERLRASLGTVANIGQLITTLFKLAKEFGLSTDQVIELLS
jgi:hypothetical protein